MEDKLEAPTHLEQESPLESDHPDTARIIRKLDFVIVPLSTILYLVACESDLDRGNIGNAKLQGLYAEICHNSSTKYSVAFAAFYITYIIFNVPGNLLVNLIRPNFAIAIAAMIWGIASTSQAGTHSFAGLVVARLFIGIGEAGFGTAMALYYSRWYRRHEVAKRNALYIGAGAVAGTCGGLIAFGVQHIHGHIANWRALFLIEGLPAILMAVLIGIFLPSTPEATKYLNEDERAIIVNRLTQQGLNTEAKKFDSSAAWRAARDPKSYLNALIYMSLNLSLASVSGFLPSILVSFGYTAAKAQLFTVAPYAVCAVVMVSTAFLSDHVGSRGPFVAGAFSVSAVGFAILLGVHDNEKVKYFAVFLVVCGTFTTGPLMLSWVSNNAVTHTARGVQLGMMNGIGQCFSILAAFSFPAEEAPHYTRGFALNFTFNIVAAITAAGLWTHYKIQNRRLDRESAFAQQGGEKIAYAGDLAEFRDPNFRYTT